MERTALSRSLRSEGGVFCKKAGLAALLACVLLAGCRGDARQEDRSAATVNGNTPATFPATEPDKVVLRFLHIADTHGRLEPYTRNGRSVGGWGRLATIVKRRGDGFVPGRVLLVHAGDVLSRGDKLTRDSLGAANVTLMNMIGFDAWTPGNGEFYDGAGVLRDRIEQAEFPVLTANVIDRRTDKPIGTAWTIHDAGPVRVGLLGLCLVRHHSRAGLEVRDAIESARKTVARLQGKADLIVAVTHLGLRSDRKLAQEVPGIDLILGGHSHDLLPRGETITHADGRRTVISHSGEYTRTLAEIDATLDRTQRGWTMGPVRVRIIEADSLVPVDEEVERMIETLKREMQAIKAKKSAA